MSYILLMAANHGWQNGVLDRDAASSKYGSSCNSCTHCRGFILTQESGIIYPVLIYQG